jgi:hypothetical protein
VQELTVSPVLITGSAHVWGISIGSSYCSSNTGSIDIGVSDCSGLTYSAWDGGSIISGTTKTGLSAGSHTVNVYCGSTVPFDQLVLWVPTATVSLPPIDAGGDRIQKQYCDITLSAWPDYSGGGQYTYEWYKGNSSVPSCTTNNFTFPVWSSDIYHVRIKDITNSCENWDHVYVTSIRPGCKEPRIGTNYSVPCDLLFNPSYKSSMPAAADTLSVSTVINRDHYIERTIVVPSEITLTIDNCEVAMADGADIIVQPGGSLIMRQAFIHPCVDDGEVIVTGTVNTGNSINVTTTISITECVFENIDYPLTLNNTENVIIQGNIFSNGITAITLNESENFTITGNNFYAESTAIRTSGCTEGISSAISENLFGDADTCLVFINDNHAQLEIACNLFDYQDYAVYTDHSAVKDQGSDSYGAGNTFNTASSYQNHQFYYEGPAMNYYCDPSFPFSLSQTGGFSAVTLTAAANGICPRPGAKQGHDENAGLNIEENTVSQLQVMAFPNPFENSLTLNYSLPVNCSKAQLKIYEAASGRELYTRNLDLNQNQLVIDTRNFYNGFFICSVTTGNSGSKQFKLICIK